MTYIRQHRYGGLGYAGLGDAFTAADRIAALTTGIQQSIWLSANYLNWLNTLASQTWNAPQKQLLDTAIANVQAALTRQQSMQNPGYETPGIHAAGLQLVAEDAPMSGTSWPLSAQLADMKQGLLNQIAAFGDISVYNKSVSDSAAAKSATDAIAKATDALVKAGTTYIPPGVALPGQYLPATVAASSAAQQSANKPVIPPTSLIVAPSLVTAATTTAAAVNAIPAWVWIAAAAGVGIFAFGGKHR